MQNIIYNKIFMSKNMYERYDLTKHIFLFQVTAK